jgi:hypothetical protein
LQATPLVAPLCARVADRCVCGSAAMVSRMTLLGLIHVASDERPSNRSMLLRTMIHAS